MCYQVQILPSAQRELQDLPKKIRGQLGKKITRLVANPFPPDSTKLEDQKGAVYRIRSGNYRILYTVNQQQVLITVVKVGDRKDVYRNL